MFKNNHCRYLKLNSYNFQEPITSLVTCATQTAWERYNPRMCLSDAIAIDSGTPQSRGSRSQHRTDHYGGLFMRGHICCSYQYGGVLGQVAWASIAQPGDSSSILSHRFQPVQVTDILHMTIPPILYGAVCVH